MEMRRRSARRRAKVATTFEVGLVELFAMQKSLVFGKVNSGGRGEKGYANSRTTASATTRTKAAISCRLNAGRIGKNDGRGSEEKKNEQKLSNDRSPWVERLIFVQALQILEE